MRGLLTIIEERRSARGPFDPDRSIAKRDLDQILEAARWVPTAHNMQTFEIIVVDDRKQLEAIGKTRSQISETFLRKNFQQMSFSEEELRRKKVGVLGFRRLRPSQSLRRPQLLILSSDSKELSSIQKQMRFAGVARVKFLDSVRRTTA